jgi:hypothetical protein
MHIAASTVGAGAHHAAVAGVYFMAANRCGTPSRCCPSFTGGRSTASTAYGRGCPAPSGIAGGRTMAGTAGGCGRPWYPRVARSRTMARAAGGRGCLPHPGIAGGRTMARAAGGRGCLPCSGIAGGWTTARAAGTWSMAGRTACRSSWGRRSRSGRHCRRSGRRRRRPSRCRRRGRGLLLSIVGVCPEAYGTQNCQD